MKTMNIFFVLVCLLGLSLYQSAGWFDCLKRSVVVQVRIALYCSVLCCTVLYFAVCCCIVLYCISCTIIYYTIMYYDII
ncbi:hypothetical protein J3Q64DRAFT_1199491 [Phycomyces blakesleeanus]|uniref:Uncharacterized protein n=1 Tax=Phycomyces blakesleeanus TaxID=4837 RepID=A0ABR3AS35_PHYBL